MKKIILPVELIVIIFFLTFTACRKEPDLLTLPFSQYVIYEGAAGSWKYSDAIENNESVIAPPKKEENWDEWYRKLKEYQLFVRNNLNDTAVHYIDLSITKGRPSLIDFNLDRITALAYNLNLKPSEKIVINGRVKPLYGGVEWSSIREELIVPEFNADSFAVNTVLRFEAADTSDARVYIKGLTMSVPATADRETIYNTIASLFSQKSKGIDLQLYERPENQWLRKDFVQGFVYIWDKDFWDYEKGEYKVKEYCEKNETGIRRTSVSYDLAELYKHRDR